MDGALPYVAFAAVAGLVGGLLLLVRGIGGHRDATRIGDTATSRIATLAAGEVQVSGVIEAAELTLVSPLQSATCIYYDASVDADGDGPGLGAEFHEQRAVGFRVRDASGDIRVFPNGARWDAPTILDGSTDLMGDEPAGLALRTGSAVAAAGLDREAAIAALLSIRPATASGGLGMLTASRATFGGGVSRRRYREALLVPGDAITVIGRALPFSDLADPTEADVAVGSGIAADDPEVSGDIAEARAAGLLEDTPEAAWGNAAIPGFGIGRPVRTPDLDPTASVLPLATASEAATAERRFTIAPDALVLASAPDLPLLIAHGTPAAAVGRREDRFLLGLLGAIVAIGSAVVLAALATDMLGG